MKQCWCPEGVLAEGFAGVRVAETSGPLRFAEIVVYDTSAIRVIKTIDRHEQVEAELARLAEVEPDRAEFFQRHRARRT